MLVNFSTGRSLRWFVENQLIPRHKKLINNMRCVSQTGSDHFEVTFAKLVNICLYLSQPYPFSSCFLKPLLGAESSMRLSPITSRIIESVQTAVNSTNRYLNRNGHNGHIYSYYEPPFWQRLLKGCLTGCLIFCLIDLFDCHQEVHLFVFIDYCNLTCASV